jgi:hypothetical protein
MAPTMIWLVVGAVVIAGAALMALAESWGAFL